MFDPLQMIASQLKPDETAGEHQAAQTALADASATADFAVDLQLPDDRQIRVRQNL